MGALRYARTRFSNFPSTIYAVQVTGELTTYGAAVRPQPPPYGGRGRRPLPRYRYRSVSLREHVLAAGRGRARTLTWRHRVRGPLRARFVLLRVRVAGRRPRSDADGVIAEQWLIVQWPAGAASRSGTGCLTGPQIEAIE
ncbi:transposase [Actinomadura namibiensis]|uniref:Transposase IS701-like DDE domain-containing protein n=1 Tax=Actinomadura namibiensis TaxID=182080 RepID=A0A7W3LS00_ACTNM|nr:transposase [Actinomadura namibiensis]MBA8953147.1 hypothetical protein [Actinomadura namibiensis]